MLDYCKAYLANMKSKLFQNDDEGQTMFEYVMMIVLVAVAVFVTSPSVTNAILEVFTGTSSLLINSGQWSGGS